MPLRPRATASRIPRTSPASGASGGLRGLRASRGSRGSRGSRAVRPDRIPGERALLGAMAVDAVGNGMYIPFSLVFFHHITGLSFAVVGAVLTAVGLLGMGALPLAGAAVDRYGARRVQFLLYGVRGAGFALYPFATSLPAFAVVALGTAVGDRAFPAAQQAYLGEIARGADRDRLQAAGRALRNAGLGAGALLASLVITVAGDRGFTAAAWLNSLSFAVAALLLRRVRAARLPDLPGRADLPAAGAGTAPGAGLTAAGADGTTAGAGTAAGRPATAGYRLVLADRAFLGLTAANFLTALGYSALAVLFPLFIAGTLNGPQSLTGAAFTVNTVLCAVGGVFVAGRIRRRGARRTRSAALGAVLFAAAFLGLGVLGAVRPHSGWVVAGAVFGLVTLYTVAEMVHNPSSGTLAVAAAPEDLRGRYMATYQLSWSLASTLAPSLFTALIAADARLPWAVLVLTALTAAALLLRLEARLPAEAVRLTPPHPVTTSHPVTAHQAAPATPVPAAAR
jgi:MFS family permease